ncbi:unnamed protein product [Meloidogyne enterolobii]|uniref:Uncharacterized protein n=1 Tax=Meloidogyne enterolobii TaxID=390850 RepID=A0ACB0ZQT6_MELEN
MGATPCRKKCKKRKEKCAFSLRTCRTPTGHLPAVPNWVPHQYIEKAYVLYDYESRNADELRLYQGATVYVLKKNEDGWFEGVMDGITGLFPGNYVQTLQN